MGEELVGRFSPKSFFWEQLPHYLAWGMDVRDYWHGDNLLPRAYAQAAKERAEADDFRAWVSGRYILCAIASVFCNDGKGSGIGYPEMPFSVMDDEEAQRQARERRTRAAMEKMIEYVGCMRDADD